jgi:DNA-directed RNA polymerase subunit RPC12/RpoP
VPVVDGHKVLFKGRKKINNKKIKMLQ